MKDNTSLTHFGILGMKWGVRKSQPTIDSAKRMPSKEHLEMRRLNKKGVAAMTDAELKTYVSRMNLERQYKDLNRQNVSAGRKFVVDIIKEIGKEAIKTAIKSKIKH